MSETRARARSRLDSFAALTAYRDGLRARPQPPHVVRVCGDTGCDAGGGLLVLDALRNEVARRGLGADVGVRRVGCMGFCSKGPVVTVESTGAAQRSSPLFYQLVTSGDASEILDAVLAGEIVERLVYSDESHGRVPLMDEIPFYARQMRVLLDHSLTVDPTDIDAFIGRGGYEGLAKALGTMTPEEVVAEMVASGMRGRGGAGFPTGVKWRLTAEQPGDTKYVICNGSEGDPGAFSDRGIYQGDPHAVLEGMIIGAYAVGAREGYVYCKTVHETAVEYLKRAIRQAEKLGLLGDDILGSGFGCRLKLKESPGGFVCGEETALSASIEGRRGMPRMRPPFPSVAGLWGKPTNVNNVETWAYVGPIIEHGAAWFSSVGTDNSKGTKVFSLAGKAANTGLVEVPMGATLRELIFGVGGGMTPGHRFKAVLMGGPAGGCLCEQHLDLPVDYESLREAGAIMGSGGVIVMDDTTCMVDLARFFIDFTQSESCGKCVPCRIGTKRMLEILDRITSGDGEPEDLERLEKLARTVKATSLCGLGVGAPNPVLSTVQYFRHEYEQHIHEKRCPSGACQALAR